MSSMNKNTKFDDISENLKQTMKKISDLDTENDVLKDEEDNSNTNMQFFKGSKASFNTKRQFPNMTNLQVQETSNRFTGFRSNAQNFTQNVNESLYNSRPNYNKKSGTG